MRAGQNKFDFSTSQQAVLIILMNRKPDQDMQAHDIRKIHRPWHERRDTHTCVLLQRLFEDGYIEKYYGFGSRGAPRLNPYFKITILGLAELERSLNNLSRILDA